MLQASLPGRKDTAALGDPKRLLYLRQKGAIVNAPFCFSLLCDAPSNGFFTPPMLDWGRNRNGGRVPATKEGSNHVRAREY